MSDKKVSIKSKIEQAFLLRKLKTKGLDALLDLKLSFKRINELYKKLDK